MLHNLYASLQIRKIFVKPVPKMSDWLIVKYISRYVFKAELKRLG